MSNISAETVLKKLNEHNIFVNKHFTLNTYTEELLKFQEAIADYVYDEVPENVRIDDIKYKIKELAIMKGVENNKHIKSCLSDLTSVNKEISICVSGLKGEERVAKVIEYVERKNLYSYRNVYINKGEEETELDNVILTDNGFIILEVKTTKSDVTITEDGRILNNNGITHIETSIGDKMEQKRRLLRSQIEKSLKEEGVELPVNISSCIVFSNPYKTYYHSKDLYRKERWCFRGGLQNVINNYYSGIKYTCEELKILDNIMSQLKTNIKAFESKINMAQIKNNFAYAMEILLMETQNESKVVVDASSSGSEFSPNINNKKRQKIAVDNKHIKWGRLSVPTAAGFVFATATLMAIYRKIS